MFQKRATKMKNTIYSDEFEDFGSETWSGGALTYDLPSGINLSSAVYVLKPGKTSGLYHYHHGTEEMMIMIEGTPLLRTAQGEYRLQEGEVVAFGIGPESAHQVINDTDKDVRMVFIGHLTSPDAVEYPDEGQLSVMARTNSQIGTPLWDIRTINRNED